MIEIIVGLWVLGVGIVISGLFGCCVQRWFFKELINCDAFGTGLICSSVLILVLTGVYMLGSCIVG